MKVLFLAAGIISLVAACNNSSSSPTPSEHLQDSIDRVQTEFELTKTKMRGLIMAVYTKANGGPLDTITLQVLKEADSIDLNCLVEHRALALERKKLESEMRLKDAGGSNRATILNYKLRIAKINTQIADLKYNHPSLYNDQYWDQLSIDQFER